MQGPNAVLNTVTYPPGASNTQPRVVIDGVRGAIFVYGTGGALIGSWAISTGNDGLGNSYPQGLNVSVGTLSGSSIVGGTITGAKYIGTGTAPEFILYSGTPAANNMLFSISSANVGNDGHGNAVVQGFTVYFNTGGTFYAASFVNNEIVVQSGTSQASYPTAQGVMTLFVTAGQVAVGAGSNSVVLNPNPLGIPDVFFTAGGLTAVIGMQLNGTLFGSNPQSTGIVRLENSDASVNINANNGTQPLTKAWSIAANDAQAGTTYEIEVPFNGTFQTATLGFKPSLNGTPMVTSGGDVIATALFTAGTGFAGKLRMRLKILTTGAGGTANLFIDGIVGQNAARSSTNQAGLSSQNTGFTFNTTVANTIAIDSVWGASVAGQTVTGNGSDFARSGN